MIQDNYNGSTGAFASWWFKQGFLTLCVENLISPDVALENAEILHIVNTYEKQRDAIAKAEPQANIEQLFLDKIELILKEEF